ncbi:MAG: MFS transporter [Alphaproteobacteria bacterium]
MKSDGMPKDLPVVYSANYVRYAVGILSVGYLFNFADRQILSILMQPIKQEMQLSDTELGFLSGLAFAMFYTVMGFPIARLADKYSRVNILAVCIGLWSFMTVLSGVAANFLQLLAARMGVGIGEAGGNPASHSLIADYVPVDKRSSAMGIYALGVPLGLLVGFLLGGWLEQLYGWRTAFLALGFPGVILALVLYFTLDEPPRGNSQGGIKIAAETPPVMEVVRHMWRIPSYWHMALGAGLQAFGTYGVYQWMPSFLIRSYGMQSGEIGTWLALIIGGGGAVAAFTGGYFADMMAKRDMRWQMWLCAIWIFSAGPTSALIYFSGTQTMALVYLLFPVLMVNAYIGPLYAMTQNLAPLRMRAMAAAVLFFVINFIGLAIGPQVIGILSDFLAPDFGQESLRYALLATSVSFVWSAYHLWRSAGTLRADLARAAE